MAFFEAIMDIFPGFISVVSKDFRVLYANESLKRRCGEDPVGKPCYEVFHGLKEVCAWCKKDEVLRDKKVLLWEVKSPKDGQWYEVRSIPFKFEEEWAYLSVVLNITEKKELEQKLERQLRFFREILEKNPALIVFNQGGKLTFVNRTFEKVTGIPREEALNKDLFELLVPEEDRALWHKHCEEVRAGIFQEGVELPIRSRKGEKRYLLWNCVQVEAPEGEPTVIGLAVDITDQKLYFEQYLQAQKMESLGRFTGVILHELNNLFMALQGCIGLAKLKFSDPEKLKECLEKMERLIERWRGMSHDLLSFTRKSRATSQTVDLAQFLHRHRETFSQLLGSKIQMEMEVPQRGLFTEINPIHLQQILFNLISNSKEAMPEGGKVIIRLEKVVLSERTAQVLGVSPGIYLLLTFEDNGPGISSETLPHIFEPYFTTKETGTGLGLATVYSLVKQYQGHIAVYSTPEKGTTFRIYLPQKPTKIDTIPQPSKEDVTVE